MAKKLRLYQYLRQSGLIESLEEAKELVKLRKITVNDKIVQFLHFQINPKKDIIKIDGKIIIIDIPKVYLMLNKPIGYITSPQGKDKERNNVLELIKVDEKLKKTLFAAGRLDMNTSGLLLITNDGKFVKRILHPRNHIEKEYEVKIEKELTSEEINKIEKGFKIKINGKSYQTLLAKVQSLVGNIYSLAICEGKKRQIRVMMKTLGHPVLELKRARLGKLKLGKLEVGKFIEIKKEDVV